MTVALDLGRELLAMDDEQLAEYFAGLGDDEDLAFAEAALEAADVELAAERKTMPLSKAETFRRLGYEPICKPRVLAIRAGVHPDDAPQPCGRCPQEQFHQAAEFDVLYGGAAGPGKSRALVCEGLAAAMAYPGIRIAGFRETYDALAESLLAELEKLDFARALGAVWHATKHNLRFRNGSVIRFRHARTVEHAKLRMGGEYQLLLPDERGLTDPEVIEHLMERLRSSRADIPVIGVRSATNPGGPGHSTLKARYVTATDHGARSYVDEFGRSVRFIAGKATDNPYLGEDYIRQLDAIPDPARRAAMRDGSWDSFVGQFFSTWRYDRHTVEPFAPPPEWARYEGVDYGYAKPWAVLFAAVDGDGRAWVWNELYAVEVGQTEQAHRILDIEVADGVRPRNRAADPSMWAKTGEHNSNADIYRDEGVSLERANNDRKSGWARVMHYLGDAPACDLHRAEGWDQCSRLHVMRHAAPNLIRTLPDCGRDKRNPEDLDTAGEDHCLIAGTMVRTESGDVPIEHVRAGDRVLTRAGFCRIAASGLTNPAAPVIGLRLSNGSILIGTANHPTWVEGRGFVSLDAVRYGDRLLSCPESSESSSTASPSGATRTHQTPASATTSHRVGAIVGAAWAVFTRKSGRPSTVRSPMAVTSITATGTRSTTTRQTLSASPKTSTSNYTRPRSAASGRSGSRLAILRRWLRRRSGMVHPLDVNGIASTAGILGRIASPSVSSASSAAVGTRRSPVMALSDSARTTAGLRGGAPAEPMTRSGSALAVVERSSPIDMPGRSAAPVVALGWFDAGISAVYNLTVEDQPEYFANGVLVHNCVDALRYLLMELGSGASIDVNHLRTPSAARIPTGVGANRRTGPSMSMVRR